MLSQSGYVDIITLTGSEMIELGVLTPRGWLIVVQVVDGKPVLPPEPPPLPPSPPTERPA